MHNSKKHLLSLSFAAGVTCLSSAAIVAQAEQSISIIPGIGYYSFDNDLEFEDDSLPSIGIRYQIGDHWATEINYAETEVDGENNNSEYDWNYTRLDGFYNFAPIQDRIVPFLVAGIGESEREDVSDSNNQRDETLINAGAGVRFLLDQGFSIIADLRALNSIDHEQTSGLFNLALSYAFSFGNNNSSGDDDFEISQQEQAAEQIAATQDNDNDGIPDSLDECDNTPAGIAVGANGCGLDGDLDGVADYKDECVQTPADVQVDTQGCPLDQDADKIADYKDECPNSDPNNLIDEKGCAIQVSQNIQFKLNSAKAPQESLSQIEELATFLSRYNETIAVIEGHSDSSGDAEYNAVLSQQRAETVRQILVEQFGIDPRRIKAIGYGEDQPIASNSTAEGRFKNRRVTATITKEQF